MPAFWTYYLAWVLLAYVLRNPAVLAGIVLFLVLRPYIPDPKAILRALSRSRSLRAQVAVNPANAAARRELAEIHLEMRRPRAALKLVEEALQRAPDDAELTFLQGLALQRSGRAEAALAPLVRAVELDPRIRFGEPFLVAGDALSTLGRHEQAVDAYERYVDTNSSDIVGYVRLARAHARLGQRAEARKQLGEGLDTLASLPGWHRRRAFLRGHLGAFWTRVWWLRQPAAIALLLSLVVILAGLARAAYPLVANAAGSRDDRRVSVTGKWTIAIGREFREIKDGDSWQASSGRRRVSVGSLSVVSEPGEMAPSQSICVTAAEALQDSPGRLQYADDSLFGQARISRGDDGWVLEGVMCAEGAAASCLINFRDRRDRDWAVATWRSLRHP